jgi:hypothetical protein
MSIKNIFLFSLVSFFSVSVLAIDFTASDTVFNCFAERLKLIRASREQVLDRMIECYGLEKSDMTRALLLGVVTSVLDKHREDLIGVTKHSIVIEQLADEIVHAIDRVIKGMTIEQKKKKKKEGWFKKKHLLLLFLGIGISVTIYFAIKALVGQKASVADDVKAADGVSDKVTEKQNFNVQVGAGLKKIPIDKTVSPDNLLVLNAIHSMENQVLETNKKVDDGFMETNKKVDDGFIETNKNVDGGFMETNKKVDDGFIETNKNVDGGFMETNKKVDDLSNKVEEGIQQFVSGGVGYDNVGREIGGKLYLRHKGELRKLFGFGNFDNGSNQSGVNVCFGGGSFPQLLSSYTSTPS